MTHFDDMTPFDEVTALFSNRGSSAYFGESVSMTEHALQAAHFAQAAAAAPALILAALLHDVGHLIEDVPQDIADWHDDAHHEEIGSRWLASRFPAEVYEPVRLHVPAKRYLCATDTHYFSTLSPASIVTLKLQGGPMTAFEVAKFETQPYHVEAVRIRRWDDQGKIPGLVTANVTSYRTLIDTLAASLTAAPAAPHRKAQ
jgi:phosphonate degradation associated HDIG domain protein